MKKAKVQKRFMDVECPKCSGWGVFDKRRKCVVHYSRRKEGQVVTDVHHGITVIAVETDTLVSLNVLRLEAKLGRNPNEAIKKLLSAYEELEQLKKIGVT